MRANVLLLALLTGSTEEKRRLHGHCKLSGEVGLFAGFLRQRALTFEDWAEMTDNDFGIKRRNCGVPGTVGDQRCSVITSNGPLNVRRGPRIMGSFAHRPFLNRL